MILLSSGRICLIGNSVILIGGNDGILDFLLGRGIGLMPRSLRISRNKGPLDRLRWAWLSRPHFGVLVSMPQLLITLHIPAPVGQGVGFLLFVKQTGIAELQMHWVAPRWGGQLSAQSFNYAWRARMHNTGVHQVCLLHLDLHSLIGLRLAALGRGLTDLQEKRRTRIDD